MRSVLTIVLLSMTAALAPVPPAQPAVAQSDANQDGHHGAFGDAGGFWSILPPGQVGVFNAAAALEAQTGSLPEHAADQAVLYDALLDHAALRIAGDDRTDLLGVTDGDLAAFYKDGSFGTPEVAEVVVPDGAPAPVVIARDARFGVPTIVSENRDAAMYASGYAVATDRLFLIDVLRHLGRGRVSELLGASAANRAMDREQLEVAPYDEESGELTQQITDICNLGAEGRRVCADMDAFVAGINQYVAEARLDPAKLPAEYPALQILPTDFIPEDGVAIASLVGGIFGKGGGNEVANSLFLSALEHTHGPAEARRVFADFRSAEDPEAPVTASGTFGYNQPGDIDPASVARIDPESVETVMGEAATPLTRIADGPLGPIDLRTPSGASNAILIGAAHTDGEAPIAVFGPQTGYFTPQLLFEFDMHAPGVDARGASFAGTNLVVQLGRGRDYAWSATSAGADNVDEWVVRLCEPDGAAPTRDSVHYEYQGTCQPMDVFTQSYLAKPTAGGFDPTDPVQPILITDEVRRTVYGPVTRTATVDGDPVAITVERSTYGAELRSAVGFSRIQDPDFMTDGVDSFYAAFDGVDYTFNWFYADTESIAYTHSCLCPIRDPRTDPDLPTWGTGEWDWTGEFLPPDRQPREVDPPDGFFANWNNKQAHGFRANDANYSYSSTYRSEFLASRARDAIASGRPLTRGDVVNIAMDAATVDLNGQEIYPLVLEVLGDGPPPGGDAQLAAMRDRLAGWVAAGGHRRDLDGDGSYDHAVAVAIGDAMLRPMLDAVLQPVLQGAPLPQGVEDSPRQGLGSAYNGGQANFLHKDLRQVLGDDVQGARSRTYCGDGDLAACRALLWSAMADAAKLLGEAPEDEDSCVVPDVFRFGSDNVDDWVYEARCDAIIQSPVGIVDAGSMRWQNRPTFQQVVEVGTRAGRIGGLTRTRTAANLSRHAFASGARTVVVATAQEFPDAVVAAPLAAALDAPVLLSFADALDPAAAAEIRRLGATEAVVLGGTVSLSEQVVADLEGLGLDVRRLRGPDRFATAAAVADELGVSGGAVVATGTRFPDALAAGPYAAATDRPIVLVADDAVPDATAGALAGAGEVVVAGGTAAVSEEVAASVGATRRIGGPERMATAVALAEAAIAEGMSARATFVATAADYPDALAAASAAIASGGVVVLVPQDQAPAGVPASAFLAGRDDEVAAVWIVGGQVAIDARARQDLEAVLGQAR